MIDPLLIAANIGGAALCGVAAYGTFVPQSQLWGKVVVRAPASDPPAVALTFDDGPTDGPTDRILDLLAEADVRAAFFVVGQNCRRSPKLLRRMHNEGHLIANHTFDHSHHGVWGMQRYWDDQLRRTDEAIADAVGLVPAMFRPPMGFKQLHTMRAARKRGQQVINWTRKARDGVATTSKAILDRLQETTGPGDILLLHDGIEPSSPKRNPEPTIAALPLLIARLKERGLHIRRVDEMLGMPGYHETAQADLG